VKLRVAVLGVADIARTRNSHSNFPTGKPKKYVVGRCRIYEEYFSSKSKDFKDTKGREAKKKMHGPEGQKGKKFKFFDKMDAGQDPSYRTLRPSISVKTRTRLMYADENFDITKLGTAELLTEVDHDNYRDKASSISGTSPPFTGLPTTCKRN